MSVPARVEALERSQARSVGAWLLFLFEATLLFAITGFLSPSLGAFTPDPGVLLLLALSVHGDARGLWSGALAVSAARIAVGVDPPAVVLTGYLAVAAVHASLGAVVDPDRLPFRFALACVGAGAFAAWLRAVHALRHAEPLGLASSASFDRLGLPALASSALPFEPLAVGLATGFTALALLPVLRLLPGVVPRKRGGA